MKKSLQSLSLPIFFWVIMVSLLALSACETSAEVTNPGTPEECVFHPRTACNGFSFSIVNKDTYENLVGEKRLIHPDSLVITNTRGDVMHHTPFSYSDGWFTIEEFSPFDELTCFNQCKLDSSFTRTYYVYMGNGDTDTLDVYFKAKSESEETFFNQLTGEVPDDRADSTGSGYSVYWFRKTIN